MESATNAKKCCLTIFAKVSFFKIYVLELPQQSFY